MQTTLYCKKCRRVTTHITRGAGRLTMVMCTTCGLSEHRSPAEAVARAG